MDFRRSIDQVSSKPFRLFCHIYLRDWPNLLNAVSKALSKMIKEDRIIHPHLCIRIDEGFFSIRVEKTYTGYDIMIQDLTDEEIKKYYKQNWRNN